MIPVLAVLLSFILGGVVATALILWRLTVKYDIPRVGPFVWELLRRNHTYVENQKEGLSDE